MNTLDNMHCRVFIDAKLNLNQSGKSNALHDENVTAVSTVVRFLL